MNEMKRGDSHTFIFNSPVELPELAVLSFSYSPDPVRAKYIVIQKQAVLSNGNKTLTFAIEPADTAKLNPGKLYYDVQFTTGEGRVASIPTKTIELVADVTVGE